MVSRVYQVVMQGEEQGLVAGLTATGRALRLNEEAFGSLAQQMARAGQAGTAYESAQKRVTAAAIEQQQAVARARFSATGQAQVLGGATDQQRIEVLAGIRQAAQQRERAEYAQHARALDGIREAANAREREQYRAQQAFIQSIQRTLVGEQAARAGKSARAALLELQAAQLGVSQQAAPLIARIAAADARVQSFGRTGRLTALELQQVGFQLNDLAVQVASGSNPLIALVQQGSQLSGTFGGIRPALAAVASLLTPVRLAIGGAAAGLLALGTAYVQGYRESRAFNDAIAVTGNYAGQTAGQVEQLVGSVSALVNVGRGATRDVLQQVVGSAQFGPQNVQAVTAAVLTLQKFTGEASEDIVKRFAAMTGGVAKWAAEQNKAYNFLTPQVYEQIRALEAQGRTQDAVGLAVAALSEKFAGQTRNLGLLERGYEGVKRALSDLWDTVKGIGRDQTTQDQLDIALDRLAALGDRLSPRAREAAEQRVQFLKEQRRLEQQAAQAQASNAEDNQREIERRSAAHQAALASIDRGGYARRQAAAEVALAADRAALELSFERAELSLASYVQRRAQLEAAALAIKERAVDFDIALERRRTVGTETEVKQQEARIAELIARRRGLEAERIRLDEQVRKRFGITDEPVVQVAPSDALRRLRPADEAAAENAIRERRAAGDAAAAQLLRDSRALSVEMIVDARERSQALLAIEVEEIRRRLDLESRSADDRERVEQQLADFIVLRERQITEQLKPEWQRQLELWEDTARRRQQVNDEVNQAFVDGGRAAFGELFATGKLNFDSLAQYALRTFGEQFYERLGIGRAFQQAGNVLVGGIDAALSPRGAAASEPAPPSAERDVLRQLEAAAAQEIAQTVASTAAETGAAAATASTTAAMLALQTTGIVPSNAALAGLTLAANTAAAALAAVGSGSAAGGLLDLITGGSSGAGGVGFGGGDGAGYPFARGAAFDRNGVVDRFAMGDVFNRPTRFRYGRGRIGEMGEAGAEAIMPLRKGRDGRLGVEAAMAAPPAPELKVEIHNNAAGARVRAEQTGDNRLRILVDEVEGALGERIDNGVGLAGSIGGRFGLNSGAALIR